MIEDKRLSIFLRSIISEGGLHYKPGPEIVARQNSSKIIKVVLRDLASGKQPFNLSSLGNFTIYFLVRKHRYPHSTEDIVIDLLQKEISWSNIADLDFELTHDDLAIPATEYWYDIVIEEKVDFFAIGDGGIYRPPLGRFKVVK